MSGDNVPWVGYEVSEPVGPGELAVARRQLVKPTELDDTLPAVLYLSGFEPRLPLANAVPVVARKLGIAVVQLARTKATSLLYYRPTHNDYADQIEHWAMDSEGALLAPDLSPAGFIIQEYFSYEELYAEIPEILE